MHLFVLRLRLQPEKRNEVIQIFRSLVGPTLVKPGCLSCGIYSNVDHDDNVILIEKWKTQEKLEQRIRSEDFKKILFAMDCAIEPPEMQFSSVDSPDGIDVIRKIRGEQIRTREEAI